MLQNVMAPLLLLNLVHEIAGGSVQMPHTSWAYRFRFDLLIVDCFMKKSLLGVPLSSSSIV